MDRRAFRILSLLSMLGVGMTVPILISAYLAGRFFSGKPLLVMAIILFGIAVAVRNTYRIIVRELAQKSDKYDSDVGRPKGYVDEDDE